MKSVPATATLASLCDGRLTADRLIAEGMSPLEADAKGQRFARCASVLLDRGDRPSSEAVAVFVPGRIEMLGKHTDYCGGRSLLCTVERGMCFLAVPRRDTAVRVFAVDLNDSVTTAIDRDIVPPARHWSNYPLTVIRRVARNFGESLRGADIAISSDLPAASGLSSSSAMIVGVFLSLSAVNDLPAHPAYSAAIQSVTDLAGYLGCIENGQSFGDLVGDRGVGTFGGSQDHTAILCGKPGKLSLFSFCPVTHEGDIDLPEGFQFVIADSGIVAQKTGDALRQYNEVGDRARELVSLWNASQPSPANCLREVVHLDALAGGPLPAEIKKRYGDAPDTAHRLQARYDQYIAETDRIIPFAAHALAAGDWATFREMVDESQSRAEQQLMNQTPETVALQRALIDYGTIAASAFGAGFGGSVWGLFRQRDLPAAAAIPFRHFATRPGCAARFLTPLCRSSMRRWER